MHKIMCIMQYLNDKKHGISFTIVKVHNIEANQSHAVGHSKLRYMHDVM